jgi:FkbM family methyltransferase
MDERGIFLKKIINISNRKIQMLQIMQSSKLPLVIYGTGGYAKSVFKLFKNRQIKVSAACVDREYFDCVNPIWNEIPVLPLDELSYNLKSFNVIIGISNFRLAEKNLKSIEGLENTFFLDSTLNIDFFDYKFVETKLDFFFNTYNLLEDNRSKDTFIAYINAKISGRSNELYELYDANQYFPKDIITLSNGEIFIDAGAYNGDTLKRFIDEVHGMYKTIYAFEPDVNSFKELKCFVKNKGLYNINIYNNGVWKENTVMKFNIDNGNGERSFFTEAGKTLIEVKAIDSLLHENEVTFIKMDIEGSELSALQGAEQTIKQFKPKLAICVYHKPNDLITIPQYIKRLVPEYRLFLRNHLHISQELVLYATI